jgi:hypothetical protein
MKHHVTIMHQQIKLLQARGDFIDLCVRKTEPVPCQYQATYPWYLLPSYPPVVIWLWVHKPLRRALLWLYHVVSGACWYLCLFVVLLA